MAVLGWSLPPEDGRNTALMPASAERHTQIMKALLEAGTEVNAKNKNGCFGIHSDGGKTVAWRS